MLLKKYKDAIALGSEVRPKTRISLGPMSLNIAVGDIRGIEAGRIVQIVGKYSSGKSTLALDIIGQHQKSTGYPVVYVDFERSFDRDYARVIGVDTDRLYIIRANSTEEGMTQVENIIKTGEVKLVVIDSIAAAKSSTEDDKDYSDNAKMASSAGLITRFCNRVVPLLDNHDVLLLVLNQLRANFNTMSPEKEIPFGGKSLHYHTSVMVQLTNIKNTEDETDIRAVVKKNKVGAPRHITEFTIKYGTGIDHARDILNLAIERGIVIKSGAWLSHGTKKTQGIEKACAEFPMQEILLAIIDMEKENGR